MQNVAFKHSRSDFQDQMKSDIESIKKYKNISIFANRTNNLYETDIKIFNKLLIKNISKAYKKSDSTILNNVNKEAKYIAESYNLRKSRLLCKI